jgi:hypothetical protein
MSWLTNWEDARSHPWKARAVVFGGTVIVAAAIGAFAETAWTTNIAGALVVGAIAVAATAPMLRRQQPVRGVRLGVRLILLGTILLVAVLAAATFDAPILFIAGAVVAVRLGAARW